MKALALGSMCLVLLLAGCGKPSVTLYTRAATVACLEKQGLHPTSVAATTDFVAQSATGGAFRVQLSRNFVTVSFGQTLDDAANLDQAYHRFRSRNVGLADVLRTQGNAVMLWHVHPQDADLATITGCLKR